MDSEVRGASLRVNSSETVKQGNVSEGEGSGRPSVEVECVDIRTNTSCEGGSLDCN